jgi:hypothetical protein
MSGGNNYLFLVSINEGKQTQIVLYWMDFAKITCRQLYQTVELKLHGNILTSCNNTEISREGCALTCGVNVKTEPVSLHTGSELICNVNIDRSRLIYGGQFLEKIDIPLIDAYPNIHNGSVLHYVIM